MLACYPLLIQYGILAFSADKVAAFDDDEALYVDGDDLLNDGKTKIEIIETGRFNEIYSSTWRIR